MPFLAYVEFITFNWGEFEHPSIDSRKIAK
jgi:hypothetical protein